jgi:RNA-directed DNA polymerase
VGTVFDRWARRWRKTANGEAMLVRFADDVVVGFAHRGDAPRLLHDLRKWFAKFGRELHPDTTRLIQFGRFATERRAERRLGRPETFDDLGVTHTCAKTRDRRSFLTRITSSTRMRAKLKEITVLLTHRRHEPIPIQGMWLARVGRGHYAYYAVPGNISAVMAFRLQVVRHWFTALRRRSPRTRLNWARRDRLEKRWLPPANILHPSPEVRFAANTRGGSRVR